MIHLFSNLFFSKKKKIKNGQEETVKKINLTLNNKDILLKLIQNIVKINQ